MTDELSQRARAATHGGGRMKKEEWDAEIKRLRKVAEAAKQLLAHRAAAAAAHYDGNDSIGNEMDDMEWMYWASLEKAIEELEGAVHD